MNLLPVKAVGLNLIFGGASTATGRDRSRMMKVLGNVNARAAKERCGGISARCAISVSQGM